jgi:uncharacterized alpha-E superfamily protein
MLSRVADASFWMGRYLERAEHVARVLEVTRAILIDLEQVDPDAAQKQWQGALAALSLPDTTTQELIFDQTAPTSLVCSISRARENARQVREVISTEMWEHLNQAYWSLHDAHAHGVHESQLSQALNGIVTASFVWDGVADGTTSRDEGWLFLKLGKFVERLDGTCRLISARTETSPRGTSQSAENVHWIALLRCLCAMEAYKKVHPQRVDRRHVVDFLLFDSDFPRTVRYSSLVVADFAKRLAEIHGARGKGVERAFGKLASHLAYTDVGEIESRGTPVFLQQLLEELDEAISLLQRSYFLQ